MCDEREHAFQILGDLIVPETQSAPAEGGEGSLALGIVLCVVGMLAAVGFDHQSRLRAGEVGDIAGEPHLLAEFRSTEAAVAEMGPEQAFLGRHLPPETTGAFELV